jgi:putative ABC transport system permease protein
MHRFFADVRHECRQLLKHYNYTAIAVLVLSVSIGANTLMFSGANAVLFRPLPFDDSPRVVHVRSTNLQDGVDGAGLSPPDFTDLRERTRSFDSLAALYVKTYSLVSARGDPERIFCGLMSADLFRTLRVRPMLGRDFTAQDDRPQGPEVAILSYGLWDRRFARDPAVIGTTINLDGDAHTIVGVMPAGFWFPSRNVEVWLPLRLDALRAQRNERFLTVIGALKNGVAAANAEAEAAVLASDLAARYADSNAGWGISVKPLRDDRLSKLARTALFVLLVAVAFVLLIAAANVANLLLAQMTARRRELAIRASLGAGRWQLVGQILAHSGLLALLGAAGGLAFTIGVKPLVTSAIPPYLRDYNELVLDYRVLAYNMILPLLTLFACALVPAIQLSTPALNDMLQRGGEKAGETGRASRSAFSTLLVAEVALSITMMIGAGLAIRGFLHLATFGFGFQPRDVLTFRVELPARSYPDRFQRENFFRRLIAQCKALPGVLNVSATDALPISGRVRRSGAVVAVRVAGEMLRKQQETASVVRHIVMPDYFEAMRIPLLTGRGFSDQDNRDGTPVAVVSDAFVRRYLAGRNPIGARLVLGPSQPVEAVGVVGSIRAEGPDTNPAPEIYLPYTQNITAAMTVVVRTSGDWGQLARAIRVRMREIDGLLPVEEMATMDVVLGESYAGPRVFVWMCGAFAAIAVAIAAAGMYSVASYYVSRRTHEMGIRIALGAEPGHIYGLIMRHMALLIGAGAAIGMPAGIALAHGMKRLLFGVSPLDHLVYAALGLFLTLVTLAACYAPARRAVRTDPAICIRGL